ncbi:MAG TPA: hypothetical protein VF613_04160 [Longimicrobium sp.]|jgi:hypothetical protein
MKIALIGGFLITLPAMAAWIYSLIAGNWLLLGAASVVLVYNLAPFAVVAIMSKKAKMGDDITGH